MGRKLALLFLSTLLVISVTVGGANSSNADNHASSSAAVYHYVALGDSVTVGYEPGMDEKAIPYGFVERLYEQALYHGRTEVSNYGIIGLTSGGLKNYLQAITDGEIVTSVDIQASIVDPRINQILHDVAKTKKTIASADLITITIGGNDFSDLPTLVPGKTNAQVEAIVSERLDLFTENITASLLLIQELNPDVKILMADQYQPVPAFPDKVLYEQLNLVKDMFSERIDMIATTMQVDQNLNIGVAHVAESFVGKELTYTHILKRDIHPNQHGYLAISSSFAEVLWGEYRQPEHKEPIAVLVGGQEPTTVPLLVNGSTFLPMRECAELLGAQVDWHGPTQTATVSFKGKTVQFTLDTDTNSDDIILHDAKIFISVRSMGESLGFDVKYISKSKTAYINE